MPSDASVRFVRTTGMPAGSEHNKSVQAAQSQLRSPDWITYRDGMSDSTEAVSETAVRAARDVRVVLGRVRRRLRKTYDTTELTPSQLSVLSRLDKEGDASVSELAAAEGVRHQSLASAVAVLEERGMVTRRPDPGDGRRQVVSIAEPGLAFLAGTRRAGENWLTRVLEERFTEAERRTVIEAMALLDRLAES
jgi:DNA-binding MarR family transcriptional regulator